MNRHATSATGHTLEKATRLFHQDICERSERQFMERGERTETLQTSRRPLPPATNWREPLACSTKQAAFSTSPHCSGSLLRRPWPMVCLLPADNPLLLVASGALAVLPLLLIADMLYACENLGRLEILCHLSCLPRPQRSTGAMEHRTTGSGERVPE